MNTKMPIRFMIQLRLLTPDAFARLARCSKLPRELVYQERIELAFHTSSHPFIKHHLEIIVVKNKVELRVLQALMQGSYILSEHGR